MPGGTQDQSSVELCDLFDNDCDGLVDNEVDITDPNLGVTCSLPFLGECAIGANACTNEGLVCVGPSPVPEVCDELDNDCDGEVDERDGGGSVCNNPPVAIVQNVIVSADSNCQGITSIDNGSFDPDNDPIIVNLNPPGPYPLGDTLVELTVTDDSGESDSASAIVTVEDTTPPEIFAPVPLLRIDDDRYRIQFEVSAFCSPIPFLDVTLNGIPVENGQVVDLEHDDEFESEFDDGILEIEAPSFVLKITATDESGNSNLVELLLELPGIEGDDDDEDDDDEDEEDDDEEEDDDDDDDDE